MKGRLVTGIGSTSAVSLGEVEFDARIMGDQRAREKMYVKDESDDVQNTVDVTLVNDDDKQI